MKKNNLNIYQVPIKQIYRTKQYWTDWLKYRLPKPKKITPKIIANLKDFTEPTIIFSHFMVINIVVSTLRNDPRVVSFYPDNCSITEIENNEGKLKLISIGNELQTQVN